MIDTIPKLIEHAAHTHGDKPFLFEKNDSGWHGYTFSQVSQVSRSLGNFYAQHGFTEHVSIIAEGRPAWVMSEFGLSMIGAISVPLSIKLTADEIHYRLEHAEVKLVICSKLTLEKVLEAISKIKIKPSIIYLDKDEISISLISELGYLRNKDFWLYEEAVSIGSDILTNDLARVKLEELEARVKPEMTAAILYSSGTTGNPKGVMLSHKNYVQNTYFCLARVPFAYNQKTLVILPIDHCFAHTVYLYASLVRSLSLYFVDARGGAMGILRNIPLNLKEIEPYFMLTVPTIIQNFKYKIESNIEKKGGLVTTLYKGGIKAKIASMGDRFRKPNLVSRFFLFFGWFIPQVLVFKKIKKELGNMTFIINGGAALDKSYQEWFTAIGIDLYQGYGLSEASPVVSSNVWYAHKFGTSGLPLPGLEIEICDIESGKALAKMETGEICIKGDTIMQGYFKNEALTKTTIIDGWLRTGDLGFIDDDGFLNVTGRAKALLIGEDGEKYSPEDIENSIVSNSKYIEHCVLWCDHKKFVTALITLRKEAIKNLTGTNQEILKLVKEDFNNYKNDSNARVFLKNWLPASFMIIAENFTEKDETINSTMKLVRHKIYEKYLPLILTQYEGNFSIENEHNLSIIKEILAPKT